MRYQLPDGCAGVSHAGESVPVATDGTVDLTAAAAEDLLPHGIGAIEAESEPPGEGGKPGKRTAR